MLTLKRPSRLPSLPLTFVLLGGGLWTGEPTAWLWLGLAALGGWMT